MKTLLMIWTLCLAFSAFGQIVTIDDLSSVGLNLDTSSTDVLDVAYPNFRMEGGNGSGRKIRDCLLLDVRHSDVVVTLEQKLKLAQTLKVLDVLDLYLGSGEAFEFPAEVKGGNVVFYVTAESLYKTFLQVRTRDGRSLNEIIKETLPPVRNGNSSSVPTGFVYVRDCRF